MLQMHLSFAWLAFHVASEENNCDLGQVEVPGAAADEQHKLFSDIPALLTPVMAPMSSGRRWAGGLNPAETSR